MLKLTATQVVQKIVEITQMQFLGKVDIPVVHGSRVQKIVAHEESACLIATGRVATQHDIDADAA